jgi:hypothetical protein
VELCLLLSARSKVRWRFDDARYVRPQPHEVLYVPGENYIRARRNGTSGDESIVGSITDDGRRSRFQRADVFLFALRNDGQSFPNLFYNCHALRAGNARTNRKPSQGRIHLGNRVERAEVFFAGFEKYSCAGLVVLMIW